MVIRKDSLSLIFRKSSPFPYANDSVGNAVATPTSVQAQLEASSEVRLALCVGLFGVRSFAAISCAIYPPKMLRRTVFPYATLGKAPCQLMTRSTKKASLL